MRIHLLFIGKTGFGDIASAIERYVERLQHYCRLEVHYLKAEKITAAVSEEVVRKREGERIGNAVGRGPLILLDQRGRELDSEGFADTLRKMMDSGVSEIWIAVGGPVGVSPDLLRKADGVLSLSKMTLPHDLARLMLVEQLYRAFTIIRGDPYHK